MQTVPCDSSHRRAQNGRLLPRCLKRGPSRREFGIARRQLFPPWATSDSLRQCAFPELYEPPAALYVTTTDPNPSAHLRTSRTGIDPQ
ncbi:hypothetical protein TNCT_182461 [Trichonephila clavata]|uniref:Uncharacterized protein n=1 Tax=Trichonephila clavata TaxID=2740835 RepID=A0A8X6LMQ1_TRICU|nr:hypothetical protein TNCT_182461 [Trichonephila clavata]